MHRSVQSILQSLAAAPVDPAFKRGVAMLLKPVTDDEHCDTIHLSEPDFHARRFHFDEIAKAQAAFTAVRDEIARLCEFWKVDATALADMSAYAAELANELLGAVRKEYTRE